MGILRRSWYNLKTETQRYVVVFGVLLALSLAEGAVPARIVAAVVLTLYLWRVTTARDYEINILRAMGIGWPAIWMQLITELFAPVIAASVPFVFGGGKFWGILGMNFCMVLIAAAIMGVRVKKYRSKMLKVKK